MSVTFGFRALRLSLRENVRTRDRGCAVGMWNNQHTGPAYPYLTRICRKRILTNNLFCIAFSCFGVDANLPSYAVTNDGNLSSHY